MYGRATAAKLIRMTTNRASKPSAETTGRAVTAALVLAVAAGLAWAGGMICTVIAWTL